MNYKRRASLILSAAILFSGLSSGISTVFAEEKPVTLTATQAETTFKAGIFSDVGEGSSLERALKKLKDRGVVHGYEDGSFRPKGTLTRAEFCKMVNKLYGYTEKADTNFPDVTKEKWYYDDLLIAKKKAYIAGFEDGTFRGDQTITREQVCVILNRIMGLYKLYDVAIKDTVADWAKSSVSAVVSNGLMTLEEGGKFRAKEAITRQEFTFVFEPILDAILEQEAKEKAKAEEQNKQSGTGTGTGTGGTVPGGGGGTGTGGGGGTGGGETEKYYSVTYNVDGVQYDKITRIQKGGTSPLTKAEPVKQGYIFKKWVIDGTTAEFIPGTTKVTSTITVSAVFAKAYTVTFMADGKVFASITVESGKTAVPENDPAKSGYDFVKWTVKDTTTEFVPEKTAITADMTVVAEFKKIEVKYTVTFKVDGSQYDKVSNITHNAAASLTKPEPEKNGYYFVRWVIEGTDKEFEPGVTPVTSDLTVAAEFEKEEVKYTVTFVSNGEIHEKITGITGGSTVVPEKPNPEKAGYTFEGWLIDGTLKNFVPGETKVTSNMTVIAKFDLAVVKHLVTFLVDGEIYDKFNVNEGETVSIADPEKEGYFFIKWIISSSSEEFISDTTVIHSDMTVFAQFEEDLSADDEVIEEMQKLYDYLNGLKKFRKTETRALVNKVKGVINDVIKDSESTLITPEYVVDCYSETFSELKSTYYDMPDEARAEFNDIAIECSTNFKTLLIDYFYDIIPEEAFEVIGK